MRILYDGEIYSQQKTGGISRYFNHTIENLPRSFSPIVATAKPIIGVLPSHPRLRLARLPHYRFRPWTIAKKLEKIVLWAKTSLPRPDILHPTYYTESRENLWENWSVPRVITVWDMIHELFSSELDPKGEVAKLKKRVIQSASAIICISHHTKADLLNTIDVPESAVSVCHLAAHLSREISYGDEPTPDAPYFLYVGLRDYYKNFRCLLEVFKNVRERQPQVRLSVVGPPFSETEKTKVSSWNLTEHIDHWGFASDAHLAKLYRRAQAFVYPSLYEGFGIPVLEAMNCGAPVVASNRSSIPEISGNAAILFDPNSPDELTDILLSLLNDEARKAELISLGFEHSKKFSWAKTAKQTVESYRHALARNST